MKISYAQDEAIRCFDQVRLNINRIVDDGGKFVNADTALEWLKQADTASAMLKACIYGFNEMKQTITELRDNKQVTVQVREISNYLFNLMGVINKNISDCKYPICVFDDV